MKNKIITFLILAVAAGININVWSQDGNVSGKVIDRWGKPVVGAKVYNPVFPLTFVTTDLRGEFIFSSSGNELEIKTAANDVKRIKVTGPSMDIIMDISSQYVDIGFGIPSVDIGSGIGKFILNRCVTFPLINTPHRKTVTAAVVVVRERATTKEIQDVRSLVTVRSTAPIEAVVTLIFERAVAAVAVACGREKHCIRCCAKIVTVNTV